MGEEMSLNRMPRREFCNGAGGVAEGRVVAGAGQCVQKAKGGPLTRPKGDQGNPRNESVRNRRENQGLLFTRGLGGRPNREGKAAPIKRKRKERFARAAQQDEASKGQEAMTIELHDARNRSLKGVRTHRPKGTDRGGFDLPQRGTRLGSQVEGEKPSSGKSASQEK